MHDSMFCTSVVPLHALKAHVKGVVFVPLHALKAHVKGVSPISYHPKVVMEP